MSDMNKSTFPSQPSSIDLNQVFSRLAPQDFEQLQLLYQHWSIQQQINDVQQQIATMQGQLAETVEQIERVHPSALALATLARLQSSGVEDIDLLDRMLERGEEWLDRTIQHLEYCEQLDVIRGDYEEWCHHALEDAFAWLDSIKSDTSTAFETITDPAQPPPAPSNDGETAAAETTEELFLQKIMSEEPGGGDNDAGTGNGDEKSEEVSSNVPDADIAHIAPVLEETTLKVAAVQTTAEEQGNAEDEMIITSAEDQDRAEAEDETIIGDNSTGSQEKTAGRRSNFMQRFLSTLWP